MGEFMNDLENKQLLKKIFHEELKLSQLKEIISKLSDVNIIDDSDDGQSLLENIIFNYGSEYDISNLIKLLLDKGIKINYQDWYGNTALHLSIYSRIINITKILLENGANPNIIRFEESETVLDFALSEYYMSENKTDDDILIGIIKLLIHHGGKTRNLLFTKNVETYLLIQTGYFGYPTGLFTLNGNILAEDIPGIDKKVCDEFMYWLLNGPSKRLFENEPENPLVVNYYNKQKEFLDYFRKLLPKEIIVGNNDIEVAEEILKYKKINYIFQKG